MANIENHYNISYYHQRWSGWEETDIRCFRKIISASKIIGVISSISIPLGILVMNSLLGSVPGLVVGTFSVVAHEAFKTEVKGNEIRRRKNNA